MNTRLVISAVRFTVAMLSIAAMPLASSVAAPPGGGSSLPPVVDVAYMNITSSVWGEPNTAAVRGVTIDPAGTASGDVALWKGSSVYYQSMSWNPDGSWLAWAQYVDKKGTRAIVAAQPGRAMTTVLAFPNGDVTRRPGIDTIAWGRGCDGRSVIAFVGDDSEVLDALYVFDPFVANAQARRLYVVERAPTSRGAGMAFSPEGQHLAFAERYETGFSHVVALPLTCLAGDVLPTAAGPPQRLFAVLSDAGIGGGLASTVGLDWSSDGRRIAASVRPILEWQGRVVFGFARIHVGELAYDATGSAEQVSAADPAMQVATSDPAAGQDDYSDELPSWGPSSATDACDRMAFSRSNRLMIMDVPRSGYTAADCATSAPTQVSTKLVGGLDWK